MNRIRKLLVMLTMLFFCLVAPALVDAEKINVPDGLLIGDDTGISVTEDGGYFFNLSDLMPGDTITRNLVIQNNRKDDYRLKMIITPKSHKGPINLIESMQMTFTYNGKMIYDGNLSSDEAGKTVDAREIDFGIVSAGSKQTMAIELKVLQNISFDEFMAGSSEAIVTWTFEADRDKEVPPSLSEPEDPTAPSTSPPSTTKPVGKHPNMGERLSKMLFVSGGIFLIITIVLFYKVYIKT